MASDHGAAMTAVDVKRLRELAEKATPGERIATEHFTPYGGYWIKGPMHADPKDGRPHIANISKKPDAEYIAACDPQTILSLCARVEALEESLRAVMSPDATRADDDKARALLKQE